MRTSAKSATSSSLTSPVEPSHRAASSCSRPLVSRLASRQFARRLHGRFCYNGVPMTRQRCRALRRQGLSIGQIARLVKRSESTVHWHVKGLAPTPSQQAVLRQQKRKLMTRVNARRRGLPFKKVTLLRPAWSVKLVHLVAHLTFDGRIDRYGCAYYSRNADQARHVDTLLRQLCGILPKLSRRPNGIWVVRYYHVGLAAWLLEKERQLPGALATHPAWQQQWLRAFFDDEGHVFVGGSTRRVRASQKHPATLWLARRLLSRIGIESYIDKRAQAVEIRGRENLLRFQQQINFSEGLCINPLRANGRWKQPLEKREILERALSSYLN